MSRPRRVGSSARARAPRDRGALLAWALLPTAPNYDTATHLIWARELLDGGSPASTRPRRPRPTRSGCWQRSSRARPGRGLTAAARRAAGLRRGDRRRLAAGALVAGPVAAGAAALFTASSFALLLSAYKAYADLPFPGTRAWRPAGRAAAPGTRRAPLDDAGPARARGLLRPEAWAFGLLWWRCARCRVRTAARCSRPRS